MPVQMRIKAITKDFKDLAALYAINNEAFPDDERIDSECLLDVVAQYAGEALAFYDGDKMVGFAILVHKPAYHCAYMGYFAIAAECRGKGYGAVALRLLQERYADSQLVLDMERMFPDAPNYDQRCRRLRFYERCGLRRAFWGITYRGMNLELMHNGADFHLADFRNLLADMTDADFRPLLFKI